jgi:hypothetical protein
MQHFTTTEIEWIEKYLNANYCNDLPGNTITHLHCHSDNAGQHFKNTGALEFFTHLMHLWGGAGKCSYVYSFGAPGHGKGVYDGLGGSMKVKVHNLIQGSKTGQAILGMQSGYINNVEDVYDALRHYFQSDHASICKRSRNPIDMFQLFKYVSNHNPIQCAEEEHKGLEKISSSYQFVVKSIGVVHSRTQSCWCMSCMLEMINGSLHWGADCHINKSISSEQQSSPTVYQFQNRLCTKLVGPNVHAQATEMQSSHNEMASRLTAGD